MEHWGALPAHQARQRRDAHQVVAAADAAQDVGGERRGAARSAQAAVPVVELLGESELPQALMVLELVALAPQVKQRASQQQGCSMAQTEAAQPVRVRQRASQQQEPLVPERAQPEPVQQVLEPVALAPQVQQRALGQQECVMAQA